MRGLRLETNAFPANSNLCGNQLSFIKVMHLENVVHEDSNSSLVQYAPCSPPDVLIALSLSVFRATVTISLRRFCRGKVLLDDRTDFGI